MKSSRTSFRRLANKVNDARYLLIIRSALGSVLFFLPLIYYSGFTDLWELPKLMVLALGVTVAAVTWLLWSFRSGEWRASLDWFTTVLGILAGLTILSTVFSVQPYISLFGMSGTQSDTALAMFFFLVFAFLVRHTSDRRSSQLYLGLFLLSGALSNLLSFVYFSGIPLFPGQQLPESFHPLAGSPVVLALLSVVQFFLLWQLQQQSQHRIFRVFLSLGMLVHLLVLLFVDAKLAAFGLLMGTVLLLVQRVGLKQRPYLNGWVIGATVLSIVVLSISIGKYSGKSYGVDISMPAASSMQVTLNTLQEQPILGSGPSTFFYDLVSYRPESLNTSPYADVRFTRPDNYWLQLFSGYGLLGALVFLFLVVRVFWQGASALLVRKKDSDSNIQLALWFFVLNLFLLFLSPGSMSSMLSFWLSLALLSLFTQAKQEKSGSKYLRSVSIFAILLLIVVWYGQLRVWIGNAEVSRARSAIVATEPLERVQSLLERAVAFDPWRSTYQLDIAEHALVSAQLHQDETVQRQLALSAIAPIEKAIALDPNNPVVYEQALQYIPAIRLLAGSSPLTEQAMLEQLVAVESNNVKHYRNWAKLELLASQQLAGDQESAGQTEALLQSAYTHLTKALELAPGDLDTRYHLALTHELLGSEALARDMLRALAIDYPNDPDVLFELARHEGINENYSEAIRLLQRVLEFTPRNVQVRLALAQAYQASGESEAAMEQSNIALQLDPENEAAKKIIESLGEVSEAETE